jgi:hypothetical protein
MLQNYQKKLRLTGYSTYLFNFLIGFEEINEENTMYYITDYINNHVIMFNGSWIYQTFKSFTKPTYLKAIENELFISGDNYFCKTDKNLNVIKTYSNLAVRYRGIYYNQTSSNLVVTGFQSNQILFFDRNLTLLNSVSTNTYNPYGINGFKNELFVGTTTGVILVLENSVITKIYNIMCSGIIDSLIIDNVGFMAAACYGNSFAILYHTNGTNLNFSKQTVSPLQEIKIDSRERLLINSNHELNLYY